jgi:phospholipid transport system substrate-binding protein
MRYRLCIKGAALALLVLGTVAGAFAGPATDQLKPEIDRVIAAIEDPALQAESRTADRRQAVRAITDRIFDWTEMSKRALGRHWEARTGDERAEFIPLFRDLLERAFLGKIEQYGAENVVYTEESPDGDDIIVRTRVTLKPSWEVGVDYRMAWQGTRWMISDVLVERTSLVRNFRSQFDSVIKRSSYEELVKKVRARLP